MSAKAEALTDSMRILRDDSVQTAARLAFPSEDSLVAFARAYFPETPARIGGDPVSGQAFSWKAPDTTLSGSASPSEISADSARFDLSLNSPLYHLRGTFVASGYAGGPRLLSYGLSLKPKVVTIRALQVEDGAQQEVFVRAPGTIASLSSTYAPSRPRPEPPFFQPEVEVGVLSRDVYAGPYLGVGARLGTGRLQGTFRVSTSYTGSLNVEPRLGVVFRP
jgi:hypothetical protein